MPNLNASQRLIEVISIRTEIIKLEENIERMQKRIKHLQQKESSFLENFSPETTSWDSGDIHVNVKFPYKLNGIPNYSNHIARLAIGEIAPKFTFGELLEILDPSIINPWAKTLNIIVKAENINNTGFIDPNKRYFTKYPLQSKDRTDFFVTTQWDNIHQTRMSKVPGSFIRLVEVLIPLGVNIEKNSTPSSN